MGAESKCTLMIGRTKTEGKALLETDALIFRGADARLSIPYKQMSAVDAQDGTLRVTHGVARFELGAAAAKWAAKIRNPPTRADKLGIKPEQRVWLAGLDDEELRAEIESRGAAVLTPPVNVGRAGAAQNSRRTRQATSTVDMIFYAANDRRALERLPLLQRQLKRDGAIWIVRPKGSAAISEADVMRAGKAAGLVDVKVVRYSDTHTAEKFVIPVAKR